MAQKLPVTTGQAVGHNAGSQLEYSHLRSERAAMEGSNTLPSIPDRVGVVEHLRYPSEARKKHDTT